MVLPLTKILGERLKPRGPRGLSANWVADIVSRDGIVLVIKLRFFASRALLSVSCH